MLMYCVIIIELHHQLCTFLFVISTVELTRADLHYDHASLVHLAIAIISVTVKFSVVHHYTQIQYFKKRLMSQSLTVDI